ncbi:DNA-3-methyladenine glycosylase family protein [Aquipuribacter hungaricus]
MRTAPPPGPAGAAPVQLRLVRTPPVATAPLLRWLAAHAVPGVEVHDPLTGGHTRLVPTAAGPATVTVRLPADDAPAVVATVTLPPGGDRATGLAEVARRLHGWLDLGTDPVVVDAWLARDPVLAPLVSARPGLRVPGSVDGLETALFAVLGQQVSLGAARTFAGRLMAAFGTPAPSSGDLGLRSLPSADALVEAGPEALQRAVGVTSARARALHAVAAAAADGLDLGRDADRAGTRAALLALPGIGPWTADYVALRCLGDPDAWLPGDLVLRRALGAATAREAEARAEGWRPWRGYALLHLWTAAVFA